MSLNMTLPKCIASLSLLALTACGNAPGTDSSVFGVAVGAVRTVLPGSGAQAARLQPTAGFPGLDPALIAGQTGPLMGAYVETRQALAALVPAGQNANTVTWLTADNIAVSLSGPGILTSTRGLGADLHAAETSQTAALIVAGNAGTAQRRHVYLDGIYRPQTVTLTCTLSPAGAETLVLNGRSHRTVRFDETCVGADVPVTNRYWRDARGTTIRQSSQWIGSELGMIHLQRLND